jgi:hypothetical protein
MTRSIKKRTKSFIITFAVGAALALSSCMTTKTSVGAYKEQVGKEQTYAKSKQLWLFWGFVPVGRTNVPTPADGSCEVITRYNASDVIIYALTGGIITSYTIKIKVKRVDSATGN